MIELTSRKAVIMESLKEAGKPVHYLNLQEKYPYHIRMYMHDILSLIGKKLIAVDQYGSVTITKKGMKFFEVE